MHPFEEAEVGRRIIHKWLEVFCKCDLTKRQSNILNFLLCIMITCKNFNVKIPLLSDFSLCGVMPNKIRSELEELERMNVLIWDRDEMMFAINGNIDTWAVRYYDDYNEARLEFLMDLNQRKEV